MLQCINVGQRLQLYTYLDIYEMKTGNAPEYLTKQLTYLNEIQPYHPTNASDLILYKATNNAMKRCLPYEVKNEDNISHSYHSK